MSVAAPLILHAGDRGRLEALARSTSVRPSVAHRARIVLMSAEGLTNTEIARRTGSSRPTVISWRNRYATGGINALADLPRSGRPVVVDELEVVATTLADGGRPPAHLGADHWSSRLLGKHLDISFATVARIWRKWGIQPDHVETFTFSTDIKRQAQVRDIGGLYRNLSQRAAALHRPGMKLGTGSPPADHPDPWLHLVEVSLGIITQQAIRRGTYASVHNLIEAIGALTDGWHDRHAPASRTATRANTVADGDRKATSDTPNDPHERSSPTVDSGPQRGPDRPESRPRDSMAVRAEFHGTRGRRSRLTLTTGAGS
ncbi:MAG TPA: helix-turn-helix domain-containing protein [Pseudonocardiaceae bacterium]|nr:helix-turn-helix domain-containing protein [Pseudonocardiaceae bacterium]